MVGEDVHSLTILLACCWRPRRAVTLAVLSSALTSRAAKSRISLATYVEAVRYVRGEPPAVFGERVVTVFAMFVAQPPGSGQDG